MEAIKVDIDYEYYLFDEHYDENNPVYCKIVREFEYVYFLCTKNQDKILKSHRDYSIPYLSHLKSLGFVVPPLETNTSSYDYWWGHRENKETEQRLNSKITSARIASENLWGFRNGAIIDSFDELSQHVYQHPTVSTWVIKDPNGFSGRGQKHFRVDANDKELLSKYFVGKKMLLEPVYERLFDIGTTFTVIDGVIQRQFMVENVIGESGKSLL